MKKVVIFGNTQFAQQMKWYLDNDTNDKVVCFTVEEKYITACQLNSIPVVPFEKLNVHYPKDEYQILIAIGDSKMNTIRQKIFKSCKEKQYSIYSYLHSSSILSDSHIGEGNILLERVTIQPGCNIGSGNLFWCNVNISHNATIGNFNTFAPMSSTSGFVSVGNNCFFGNNSTVRDHINIADYTLLGAAGYLSCDSQQFQVIVPPKSVVLEDARSVNFM